VASLSYGQRRGSSVDLPHALWERIQVSTSYNFFVGDTIEIGDELKGVVKAINVSYVLLEAVDDSKYDAKVDKYVPPVFIQDKVITIVKKARRLSKSKPGADLTTGGDDYYDDFMDVVKGHIIYEFLKRARDYVLELIRLIWHSCCWNNVVELYIAFTKRLAFSRHSQPPVCNEQLVVEEDYYSRLTAADSSAKQSGRAAAAVEGKEEEDTPSLTPK